MVSLEWYRSFVAVYQSGTVSGAAKGLHLTQPAVSQHVAGLEAALGIALFERMPRQMLPTEAGKRLYNQAVSAVETLAGISGQGSIGMAPRIIRLGAPTDFFSEYVLGQLAHAFRSDGSPTMEMNVTFGLAKELVQALLKGEVDCAIATQKISQPELEYQPIFTETFCLFGPPSLDPSLSAHSDLVALSEWIQAQPWIAYSSELPIIRRFWRSVFGHRLAINPQFVIPDLRGIRSAIVQGLGYSVLPDYLCADSVEQKRLRLILKPEKDVSNTLWLAYRKSERRSEQVQMLITQLQRRPQ